MLNSEQFGNQTESEQAKQGYVPLRKNTGIYIPEMVTLTFFTNLASNNYNNIFKLHGIKVFH